MPNRIVYRREGWRDVIANGFTVEHVRLVAQAIALYLKENQLQHNRLIVGYDNRFMGRYFAEEVVKVLAANEIAVYLSNEPTPTPVVAFAVKHFAASGAIMVSAGGLGAEYNGLRYIPEHGGMASGAVNSRLQQLLAEVQRSGEVPILTLEEALSLRRMSYLFLRPHYEARLRQIIHFPLLKEAGLPVVIDPLFGASGGYLSNLLAEAGVPFHSIHDLPDPLFGGLSPEINERNLQQLGAEVSRRKAAIGLANDGDASHFGAVDRQGRWLSPNKVACLLAWHLLKNRKSNGRIVRSLAASHMLDRIAEHYRLPFVETPAGFEHVSAQSLQGDLLLGCAEDGACCFGGHIAERDGLLANLLLWEMCAWEEKGLDQLVEELHEQFGDVSDCRFTVPLKRKAGQRQKPLPLSVPAQVGPYWVADVRESADLQLLLAGGHWICIQPLETEAKLQVYCEAADQQALEQIREGIQEWFAEAAI
ncbi:phosphoglucomutase/phosphomannomutase family protein [Brevibacillus fulvus]|uniref:Phosphomannomutase n=1 Tax=Brevibacillus fulvus TaxID=1125967 RepID=A0A939BR94_9BACL|nr:phosphoglucomutase/phosphomannomutase family protein [Brevibacillus fulvus]MBM7589352.1 phosphomannomutase [Brevibacillus fulvus]